MRVLARNRGDEGSVLVLTAVMLTVLLGFAGLALDAGYAFDYQQRMGGAADAAAKAAAYEVARDSAIGQTALEAFARYDARVNGFTHGVDGITVTVNRGPTSGAYLNNTGYVEVIISRPVSTYLAGLLGRRSWTVRGRAVAGLSSASGCMYVLDPTAVSAYDQKGGSTVNLPNCGIVVNSTAVNGFSGTGGSRLTTTAVRAGGSAYNFSGATGSTLNITQSPTSVQLNSPAAADPLASLAQPTVGSCSAHPTKTRPGYVGGTLSPGTYCGGIELDGGGTFTMNAGTYIITADPAKPSDNQLIVGNGASLTGTGVTIFNSATAGPITFVGGSPINLTAPTTGTYAGILLFQDRTNTSKFEISNGASTRLTGSLYFRSATVEFSGGTFGNLYTFVVANRVSFSGGTNVTLNNDTSSLPGGSPLKSVAVAE